MNTIDEIYNVYVHHPGESPRYVGRFSLVSNRLTVLEDHQGFLRRLEEGMLDDHSYQRLRAFMHSAYLQIIPESELQEGKHPDYMPEEDLGPPPTQEELAEYAQNEMYADENHNRLDAVGGSLPANNVTRPPSVFEYKRMGMDKPQTIEVVNGKMLMNGHLLDEDEHDRIIANIKSGVATLRYKQTLESKIQKMEAVFEDLGNDMKKEELMDALGALRKNVREGTLPSSALENIARAIFTDSMVPRMGNRAAYKDFLSRPKKGIHIRIDGNDFGSVNKTHGFETGDKAIVALGGAIRDSLDEIVGSKNGKAFRIGGDEFHIFVPTWEQAAGFARDLRNRLEQVPAVGGTHKLSVSIGWGSNPDEAEDALLQAKAAKKAAGYQPGQAKTHAHSGTPGAKGAVPFDTGSPKV